VREARSARSTRGAAGRPGRSGWPRDRRRLPRPRLDRRLDHAQLRRGRGRRRHGGRSRLPRGRSGRGGFAGPLAEAIFDILAELLELFLQAAIRVLQLLDAAVGLAQLVLEPVEAHHKLRRVVFVRRRRARNIGRRRRLTMEKVEALSQPRRGEHKAEEGAGRRNPAQWNKDRRPHRETAAILGSRHRIIRALATTCRHGRAASGAMPREIPHLHPLPVSSTARRSIQ
jgi:hypothetical protein